MNFKKAGIFRRSSEGSEQPEVQNDSGGMLAVWGSPGSGKTVTAVKIAKMLSAKKKNVILLLCDMTAPMLPCICSPDELECERSLGNILAAVRIGENLIKHNLAIVLNNFLLVPVLAMGMMFLLFWYIKLTAGHYKKDISTELETALSIITTAYLRSEDLQTAVEENINYLNPPVQGVFRSFLTRIKHIDPDMNAALAELKSTIDNEVWQEWCEALAACQYDHSLKSTLNPIVGKLSDMRIINGELENLVFAPRKEFISMAALVVLNIPLLYFLNKDWYATLMTTVPGKAVLAVCAAAIFLSFARVVKLTQPIEYRR